jgi:hypothetical protein
VSDRLTVSSAGRSGAATLSFAFSLSRDVILDVYAEEITTHNATSQGHAGTGFTATLGIAEQQVVHFQADYEFVRRRAGSAQEGLVGAEAKINGDPVSTALGTFHYNVPIVLGQEFALHMGLKASASSNGSGIAGGTATLSSMNSFDWLGVQGVFVDGQPVDFLVSSVSGTDWASPVPEVPMLALLLGGLGVVLRRARNAAHREWWPKR